MILYLEDEANGYRSSTEMRYARVSYLFSPSCLGLNSIIVGVTGRLR